MISIFKSRILDIKSQGDDIRFLKLSVPSDFEFRAGQYLSLSVFDERGKKIRRPFSIVNAPDKSGMNKEVEFCVKLIPKGLASEFIRELKVGNEVELFGPAGKFVADFEKQNRGLVLVAQGVGVAPFVGIVEDLLARGYGEKIILLKSSRDEKSALYEKELTELERGHGNFKFYNVFSKPENSGGKEVGHVQDFLSRHVPANFEGDFYICGLKEMITDTKEKLAGMGFDETRIFEEKFD